MLNLASLAVAIALQNPTPSLLVDPLLLVEANEIWSVIGRAHNPIWPGWDARKTPILIYFPGKQDLLINHPKPPAGFVRYRGMPQSPLGPMFIRDGETVMSSDGQNTSTSVNGIETLVVADTLSTRRQWVQGIGRSIAESPDDAKDIITGNLFPNPYSSMTMFAHEAFHVYQRKAAPDKAPNETALFGYPSLSVSNNRGLALEAEYLAAAIAAPTPLERRSLALKWLAVRLDRQKDLPKDSAAYEDATEFTEGLAKYVEYRTLELLPGRKPAAAMWLAQGFKGYGDLAKQRDGLMRQMLGYMSGKMVVNNDRFGASPVRFRLYYSGMAAGVLLDRLGVKWHERILARSETLTKLIQDALHPTAAELETTLAEVRASKRFVELGTEKEALTKEGQEHIDRAVAEFDSAPGELVIDYSRLNAPKLGFGYTSFGVLRIDDDRNLFRLVPISGAIGSFSFAEANARPVLYDRKAKTIRLMMKPLPSDADVRDGVLNGATLRLGGIDLKNVKGKLVREGRRVTLTLGE